VVLKIVTLGGSVVCWSGVGPVPYGMEDDDVGDDECRR